MKPLRFAVIGGRRGRSFVSSVRELEGRAELVAICDTWPEALKAWEGQGIKLYSDYQQVLDDREIDAVCIATPLRLHASQSIAALKAGKHVLCEVTATFTMDECWDLVEAVENSGLTYMMAENYCFSEPVLQVQNMVEQGVFGDLVYASGAYIHDCRPLKFTEDGNLTWRGELRRNPLANSYPTHSLGPVCRWLGVNRTDKLKTTATWHSRCVAIPHYLKRNFPDKVAHYEAQGPWKHADTVTTCIRTEKGILIDIRVDWASGRPHHMHRYELQGTKASFIWPEGDGQEPLIWIEDRSPTTGKGTAEKWEPLSKYREEFQHPLWREHYQRAAKAGHGGGDFFTLREFLSAIREDRDPVIDVYDAVTWSSIIPLSLESVSAGNAPVEVPDFRKGRP